MVRPSDGRTRLQDVYPRVIGAVAPAGGAGIEPSREPPAWHRAVALSIPTSDQANDSRLRAKPDSSAAMQAAALPMARSGPQRRGAPSRTVAQKAAISCL